jgi:hypothetical protein
MKPEVFEELIKDHMIKIIDKEHPQLVSYQPRARRKSYLIDIRNPLARRELPPACSKTRARRGVTARVKTPDGIFESSSAVAEFYKISNSTVSYRCTHWTRDEFYYYTGDL